MPDSVARAMRLLSAKQPHQLKLAGMTKLKFKLLLGQRNITRHYVQIELQEDLAYGVGK